MNIFREGKLIDSDISTGNVLSVELYEKDHIMLAHHGYTVNRFCEFRHQQHGWDSMDKAHVNLQKPEMHPEDDEKLVTLSLDPGGDLYFTIWESERLHAAASSEEFRRDDILSHDPSGKLDRLGIVNIRLFGLSALAIELYAPKFNLPHAY